MFVTAPTLAWLLTALACFVAGMAVTAGWRDAVALPYPEGTRPPIGVVVTVEVVFEPTPPPGPIVSPTSVPTVESRTPLNQVPTLVCDPFGAEAPQCSQAGNACSGGERSRPI